MELKQFPLWQVLASWTRSIMPVVHCSSAPSHQRPLEGPPSLTPCESASWPCIFLCWLCVGEVTGLLPEPWSTEHLLPMLWEEEIGATHEDQNVHNFPPHWTVTARLPLKDFINDWDDVTKVGYNHLYLKNPIEEQRRKLTQFAVKGSIHFIISKA